MDSIAVVVVVAGVIVAEGAAAAAVAGGTMASAWGWTDRTPSVSKGRRAPLLPR